MHEDPEAIRTQIEATRERIAYKADVPARVKEDVAAFAASTATALTDASIAAGGAALDAAATAAADARDVATVAGASLATALDAARDGAEQLTERAQDFATGVALPAARRSAAQPVRYGLIALAAGAVLGLILPVPRPRPDEPVMRVA